MHDPLRGRDVLNQPSFEDSVRMAATLASTPMAAISLLGKKCQWFKAEVGLHVDSTPIEQAFCRYTVLGPEVMVVPDATLDARFRDNPLVTSGTIRAYAGAPLVLHDGTPVGALCVIDTEPREFTAVETQLLEVLARQVVVQLQLEALIDRQAGTISDLEDLRRELDFQVNHDPLTGLLNRRGLTDALKLLLGASQAHPRGGGDAAVSLIFIDLDDFKMINDEHGHQFGDEVLALIARRLSGRSPVEAVLARIGGDEFVVGMLHPSGKAPSGDYLEWLREMLAEPACIDGVRVELRASAGVATEVTAEASASSLLEQADRAMYVAKQRTKSPNPEWSSTRAAALAHGRSVRSLVRQVLDTRRVSMAFQPIVDLGSHTLLRREALVRWQALPTDVDTSPGAFVAAAERSGQINRLGRVVLDRSCMAAAAWQAAEPGVGVSVNVSPRQIRREFVEEVSASLSEHGLPPRLLTLELTENSMLERSDTALCVLEALKRIGVRISVDDFGSGYSSMSMLCDLPVAEVKVDRQFCSASDGPLMAITEAAITLGHSLGLCVVAEGIETDEVLQRLTDLGCDAGQGFFLGRPGIVPGTDVVLAGASLWDGDLTQPR